MPCREVRAGGEGPWPLIPGDSGWDPCSHFSSSFGHCPGSQVWLLQVIYLFPWVFFKSPVYKCQILCWSFPFLLDRVVLTFLSLQGRGNYNFVIKLVGGLVIHGCRSSPGREWFARSRGGEAGSSCHMSFRVVCALCAVPLRLDRTLCWWCALHPRRTEICLKVKWPLCGQLLLSLSFFPRPD